MRAYRVILEGIEAEVVMVNADDLELTQYGDATYWNFIVEKEKTGEYVTVAAFPYSRVEYVLSREK